MSSHLSSPLLALPWPPHRPILYPPLASLIALTRSPLLTRRSRPLQVGGTDDNPRWADFERNGWFDLAIETAFLNTHLPAQVRSKPSEHPPSTLQAPSEHP